jgi:hypothetical protein
MLIEKIEVKCDYCGKVHNPNDHTFYTVKGNIYVGLEGGLIGNNFMNDGVKSSHYCIECLLELIKV